VRAATLTDNAAAGSRRQATQPTPQPTAMDTVIFEITGTGTAAASPWTAWWCEPGARHQRPLCLRQEL